MNAQKVIDSLTGKGFSFRVDEGKLVIKPKADDETREMLRQHKAEIISLLRGGETTQPEGLKISEGKTPTDSKEIAPCSPNEEILNRLGLVAVRAVQYTGKLKDFSPEQNRIAGLLDQANDLEHAEPLDTVKLAKVIGELMAALSQKPEGLNAEPAKQLMMTGT